jgi:ribosomal protein S18 acetylase RimI-like enzyme
MLLLRIEQMNDMSAIRWFTDMTSSILQGTSDARMRSNFAPVFREATPEDVEGLAKVQVLSWRMAYQGKIPASYLEAMTIDQKAEEWIRILENNKTKTIVVQKTDKGIVGFVNFGNYRDDDLPKEEVAEIRALYVHPEHLREGIGRKLAELAIQDCKKKGYKQVALWVLDSNESAQRFYQSLGFRLDGGMKIDKKIPNVELREFRFSEHI